MVMLASPACEQAVEPPEAFPYHPPSESVRQKYSRFCNRKDPLPERKIKTMVDQTVAVAGLILTSPIFLLLWLANLVEGLLIPEHRGSLIFSYNAISRGKVFPKYKIRLIAERYIDPEGARRGDWKAYAGEWSPGCRTWTGGFAKRFYLDELPQLFNILMGDISLVGPRPLACHHYERDVRQGNVFRQLIKGGLLGPSQCLKGSGRFGNTEAEFDYLYRYATSSSLGILWADFILILRGLGVVVQGKGL